MRTGFLLLVVVVLFFVVVVFNVSRDLVCPAYSLVCLRVFLMYQLYAHGVLGMFRCSWCVQCVVSCK